MIYTIQVKPGNAWKDHSTWITRLEAKFTLAELTLNSSYPVRLVVKK
jgi:hypothetical protein